MAKPDIHSTICGVIPDIDGLGVIVDKILGDESYTYYLLWHHKAGHNVLLLLILGVITYFICKRRILPVFVGAIAFLAHIFLDLVGSGGGRRVYMADVPVLAFQPG